MDSWSLRQFRTDLSIFIKLIEDNNVTGDFEELKKLIVDLDSKAVVEYKLESLCFHINGRIVGTLPDELNYCQIYFDNMLMVKDRLEANYDPLHGFYLDINIHGYKNKNDTKKAFCSSWHLDRHMGAGETKYTHPSYHFQFGGKKMELIDEELLILSCPRIPHPPMDLFLGFHFILSNFFSNKQFTFVKALLSNYDYQEIIKRAQERLWVPYFKAFDSSNTNQDFTIQKLFPLYIN